MVVRVYELGFLSYAWEMKEDRRMPTTEADSDQRELVSWVLPRKVKSRELH